MPIRGQTWTPIDSHPFVRFFSLLCVLGGRRRSRAAFAAKSALFVPVYSG